MTITKPIALVNSKDENAWHKGRRSGVTKTDVVRLISGGIRTKQQIYAEKQGEGRFHGNQHTERGHVLEPVVLEWVERNLGIPESGTLYAHGENRRHLATPDAYEWVDGEGALVEIKTHSGSWATGVPLKILRDIYWQAYVLGSGYAALAHWEVDEDGQPLTIEPELIEIPLDAEETARLIAAADDYLAWVDAGRPEFDEDGVPLEIRELIARNVAAKAEVDETDRLIREFIAADPERADKGLKLNVPEGSLSYTVSTSSEFDKAAWMKASPDAYAAWEAAQKDHRKPKQRTSLRIAPPTAEESAQIKEAA